MAIETDAPVEERNPEVLAPQTIESSLARGRPPDDEISLLDVLIVLAKRKWLLAKVTAVFGIIGLVIALVLPKQYTATSTVMPPKESNSLSSMLESQLGGLGGLVSLAGGAAGSLLKNPNDQYVAMFKSQTVEDATIRQFGLQNEYHQKLLSRARKSFAHHFKVVGSTKDGFLHVSVTDRSPKRAAEMANGWVDQFRKLSQRLAVGAASQRRAFFDTQLDQAKTNLTNAEEALKAVQEKTGVLQLSAQTQVLIESAAVLRAQIVAKQVQLQALQTFATNQNAQVVETEEELASLRAQMARLGGSGAASGAGLVLPRGQVPQVGLEYVRKVREVKYRQTLFEILARQAELAKLDEAKRGALIQVVDPALVPDHKSSPHRALIVIIAVIVGFIIAAFVALFSAGIERMRRDPENRRKLSALHMALTNRGRGALAGGFVEPPDQRDPHV